MMKHFVNMNVDSKLKAKLHKEPDCYPCVRYHLF